VHRRPSTRRTIIHPDGPLHSDAGHDATSPDGSAPAPLLDARLVEGICRQLRVDILRSSTRAGSGHPTSSLSAVELASVLAAAHLRYDVEQPDHPGNDRLVLSKGHATPLLYALLRAMGAIDEAELLSYRQRGSRLEGHPTPRLPWVDAATGSLGQGLPIGVGLALAARLDGSRRRTFVLCGDSEMAEGSMWEAVEHAAHAGLGSVTALVDVNRLGQRGPTRHGWDLSAYARRFHAFGWDTVEVDGHDLAEIDAALRQATATADQPTAIIARTVKGKGVAELEDVVSHHGKAVDDPSATIEALGGVTHRTFSPPAPPTVRSGPAVADGHPESRPRPTWPVGADVATRDAYGATLVWLGGQRDRLVALDGEVSNSTRADAFAKAFPERYVEAYIAEQNMLGMAIGLARSGWRPFVSSFAAFLLRAYDFTRMAPVSQADLTLVGTHAGVEIGPDGPSQMGLEDLAAMRAVAGATVLYPCDANQTRALVELAADVPGVSYLRLTRGDRPVVYDPDETFSIGGSRTLRSSEDDQVAIVAAGVTVHEALAAVDADGVPATVIDAYSVQPLDVDTIADAATRAGAVLTVEDHRRPGGLGEAVAASLVERGVACRFRSLAVDGMPGSATPQEQLSLAGIDRVAIRAAVTSLLG
jgi:transketolase